MVDGPESKRSLEPPRHPDAGPADKKELFQGKVLDEIRNHPPDEQLEMFRKAAGIINLSQSVQGNNLPAEQEKVESEKKIIPTDGKPSDDRTQQDLKMNKPVDSFVAPIYEALKGPNVLRVGAKEDDIERAKEILEKAAVRDPEPRQINVVMAAEEVLNKPGFKINAVINEEGKLQNISELSKKEISGKKLYGGKSSEEYALGLYRVAKAFERFYEDNPTNSIVDSKEVQLSIEYYKQSITTIEKYNEKMAKIPGINVEKAMHEHDRLRAEMYYKVGDLGFFFDRKSALPYAQQAARIYADIYNRKGPQEVIKNRKLHDDIIFAFIRYTRGLEIDGQKEKGKVVDLQRFEIEKGKLISRVP